MTVSGRRQDIDLHVTDPKVNIFRLDNRPELIEENRYGFPHRSPPDDQECIGEELSKHPGDPRSSLVPVSLMFALGNSHQTVHRGAHLSPGSPPASRGIQWLSIGLKALIRKHPEMMANPFIRFTLRFWFFYIRPGGHIRILLCHQSLTILNRSPAFDK